MSYKKIGVVVADSGEYEPFAAAVLEKEAYNTPFSSAIKFFVKNTEVITVLSGIGKVNAASAAMFLADSGCDLILNFGLSGGLGVSHGRFVLPREFLEHDFDLTAFGYKPCEKPGQTYVYKADGEVLSAFCAASGAEITPMAVCGDRFISDSKSRDYLINTFGASCCDMETAAIASVCHLTNTPFACVRRISDDASDNACEHYRDMNNTEGETLASVFNKCLETVCD